MPLTPVFHRDRCWCIFSLAHNFFLSLMLCLNPYFSLEIQTQVVHTKGTSTSGRFRFWYPTWEALTNFQYLHLFWKSLLLWGHKGLAVQAQPEKFPCSIGFPVTALYPHILSKSGFSCVQHEHSGHEPSQDQHLKRLDIFVFFFFFPLFLFLFIFLFLLDEIPHRKRRCRQECMDGWQPWESKL